MSQYLCKKDPEKRSSQIFLSPSPLFRESWVHHCPKSVDCWASDQRERVVEPLIKGRSQGGFWGLKPPLPEQK